VFLSAVCRSHKPKAAPDDDKGCLQPHRPSSGRHAVVTTRSPKVSETSCVNQPSVGKRPTDPRSRSWWSTARLPEWLAAYVGLEADATSLRCLALELIPGLLQTGDYAREVHLLGEHMTAPEEVGRWVAARVQRQHRLTGPQPLRLSAVVSEAALRRCASHPAIAPGQLKHLIGQANLPNVELRVPRWLGVLRAVADPAAQSAR
jgi:Domain of unknown function (DUF5753)